MNRLRTCPLTLLVLLSSCASQNVTTEMSPEAWRADLRHLARELPSDHVNAFHTISRETFAAEVARLEVRTMPTGQSYFLPERFGDVRSFQEECLIPPF